VDRLLVAERDAGLKEEETGSERRKIVDRLFRLREVVEDAEEEDDVERFRGLGWAGGGGSRLSGRMSTFSLSPKRSSMTRRFSGRTSVATTEQPRSRKKVVRSPMPALTSRTFLSRRSRPRLARCSITRNVWRR